jgi:SAM-dependent methyltransferase
VDERDRIRTVYARRASLNLDARYERWVPSNLYLVQRREQVLLELLRSHGMLPLGERTVLDVGCGSGDVLVEFMLNGAKPEALFGVDLLEDRVAAAQDRTPFLDIQVADASDLPFADETFDIVLAFTLFSSIQEPLLRAQVALEMQRVLRPGGGIVWYDFWINPVNPDTKALGLKDVRNLFPGARIDARRVTLAPPLARALVTHSRLACDLLAKVPPLRTHWLAWISPSG